MNKRIMTFHHSGKIIAQFKYRFRNEEHEAILQEERLKLVREYHSLSNRKKVLVFIDDVEIKKPAPLKQAA